MQCCLGCIISWSRGSCAVLVWWPALPEAQVLTPAGISVVPPLQARRAQELWRWCQAENPRLGQGRVEPWEWAVPGPQPRRAAAEAMASRALGWASQNHRRQNPPPTHTHTAVGLNVWGLVGTCYPFLLSHLSILAWANLCYACPTIGSICQEAVNFLLGRGVLS